MEGPATDGSALMPQEEARLTWERLAALHAQAAEAARTIAFPQYRLLRPKEFADLCGRADVGAHIGLHGGLGGSEILEALHRLRLVIPLLRSPKGTEDVEVAELTWYEPW